MSEMPRLEGGSLLPLAEKALYDHLWKQAHALTKRIEKIQRVTKNAHEASRVVDTEIRTWMKSLEGAEDLASIIDLLPSGSRQQVGGRIFVMKTGASLYVAEANPYREFLQAEGDVQDPKEKIFFLSPGEADRIYEATNGLQNMDGLLGKEWHTIQPEYGMRVLLLSPKEMRVKLTVDADRDVFTLTPTPSYLRDMDEELKQQAVALIDRPILEVSQRPSRQIAQAA